MPATIIDPDVRDRFRVAFFFNAQIHQLMHGITTALALARDDRFDVHVIGGSAAHVAHIHAFIDRVGGAPVTVSRAGPDRVGAIAAASERVMSGKLIRLAAQARHLSGFDAICLPERTSILLRRLGVTGPKYIHLDHGAGDRAVGFDPRIARFDFALIAGTKTRERLLREEYVRPGAHAIVGYPKFDAADAMRDPRWTPFADDRPVVLYNPHFGSLGSWTRGGIAVLEAFAAQDRYNLICAPHMRLFHVPAERAVAERALARFAACPNIHLDLGSDRSVDMTYTSMADVYLGDVSSQIYEFLRVPKPCLFLNPGRVAWPADENYAHWHFGPVVDDTAGLIDAVDAAVAGHEPFRAVQRARVAATFDLRETPSSERAARAIAIFLRHGAVDGATELGAPAAPAVPLRRPRRAGGTVRASPRRMLAQVAALALMAGVGWHARGSIAPIRPAAAETIVDEALESNAATLVRTAMSSQKETPLLDHGEIATATAIRLPAMPGNWHVRDVQIYPSDNGPGVQIMLATSRGETFTLLALRAGPLGGGIARLPQVERRERQSIAYWRERDLSIALVGQLAPQRLLALAQDMTKAETGG